MLSEKEILIRMFMSVFLGGLIGLERERLYVTLRAYSAGFRTHILVCVGAALAMVVSVELHYQFKGDAARVAAQVISGIGFLGAGAILREGYLVRGLTTAASLWAVACIGLAAGAGYYLAAALSTFLVLFALVVLGTIEDQVRKARHQDVLCIAVCDHPETIHQVGALLEEVGIIRKIEVERQTHENCQIMQVAIQFKPHVDQVLVLNKLAAMPGVYRVEQQR